MNVLFVGAHPDDIETFAGGTAIKYKNREKRGFEIYVMNADGSEQKDITNNPAFDESPSWSPDGKFLAYFEYKSETPGIWILSHWI